MTYNIDTKVKINPVWVDINGKEYYNVKEIDDRYLTNIINFCKQGRISKRVADIGELCLEALARGVIDENEYEKIRLDYKESYKNWKIRDDIKRKYIFGMDLEPDCDYGFFDFEDDDDD